MRGKFKGYGIRVKSTTIKGGKVGITSGMELMMELGKENRETGKGKQNWLEGNVEGCLKFLPQPPPVKEFPMGTKHSEKYS